MGGKLIGALKTATHKGRPLVPVSLLDPLVEVKKNPLAAVFHLSNLALFPDSFLSDSLD